MTPPTSGEGPVTPRRLLAMTPLYPPHVGGLESHAEEFDRRLALQDIHITVFTPLTKSGGASREQSARNITIYRYPAIELIPNYHLPKFWSRGFRQQWRQLAARPVDLVMSRTRFFFSGILAFSYARWHATPWLHVEHGSDFVHLNNRLTSLVAKLYDYTLGRLVLRKADWVVANSKASAQFVKKLSGRTDVTVIYRGLDHSAIAAIRPAPRSIKAITITYAGRLIDGKGVADLLAAAGA
ncbi:glycosyltransferase family 4 protein [Patescibacteria group bacterium]|nr:glycosyltransferase family 4 protein [Patescibacteria group bacterium]